MFKAFLLKFGEIGVKGKNRYVFENALKEQVKYALTKVEGDFYVEREQGRIYVEALGAFDYEETVEALQRIFGVVGICPAVLVDSSDWETIKEAAKEYVKQVYQGRTFTFKVFARRANKHYPLQSPEMCSDLGGFLLQEFPGLSVDVHEPEVKIHLEVRTKTYLYSEILPGPGGMPVGTAGRGMLLLSGGIDSPVAGYMIAKRGVTLEAVYFHAPPYTSERAKQKVADLAKLLSRYAGPIRLHIVNFTDIQLYIYEECPHEELTIIMRRYMMRIAENLAEQNQCLGLITGESIGQVASQTMQSLASTNEVCTLPVYRPVIGFDKQDIVELAEKIGTYETSILPYEDCCTIFVAKHPVTKPNRKVIRHSEEKLTERMEQLLREAMESIETLVVE